MKILVIDNYDSFTYNLVHILRELNMDITVRLNDQIVLDDVALFDKILLSPGPGIPDEAGMMKPVIQTYGSKKSILGICLGHQGIAEIYGAKLYNIPDVLHGVTSETTVLQSNNYLFKDVPNKFSCTHYHSWAVLPDSIPEDIIVTCSNDEGLIMGIRHRDYDVMGLQFHPESIMTPDGATMIKNWVEHKNIND